jgi:hypothetical protein
MYYNWNDRHLFSTDIGGAVKVHDFKLVIDFGSEINILNNVETDSPKSHF